MNKFPSSFFAVAASQYTCSNTVFGMGSSDQAYLFIYYPECRWKN